jgi:hypothetical protein
MVDSTNRHPSSANDLYHSLRNRGFTLRRDGHALIVSPPERLTMEDRAEIRERKAELMRLRSCAVIGCQQLLPWGGSTEHDCTPFRGKGSRDISTGLRSVAALGYESRHKAEEAHHAA